MRDTRKKILSGCGQCWSGDFGLSKSLQERRKTVAMRAARGKVTAAQPDGRFVADDDANVADLPQYWTGGVEDFHHLIAEPVRPKNRRVQGHRRVGLQEASPGRRFKCNRAIACAWCLQPHPDQRTRTGTAWKSPIDRTACMDQHKAGWRRAKKLVYEFTGHQEGTFFYHAPAPCKR